MSAARILVLGGITEAVSCAKRLYVVLKDGQHNKLIYSVAGKGRDPVLDCEIRIGGFGGESGLTQFLLDNGINHVVDASHPYAQAISENAAKSTAIAGVRLWAYRRPAWQAQAGDNWYYYTDWPDLTDQLRDYRRPFFTVGLQTFKHLSQIPAHQHWLIRCVRRPQWVTNEKHLRYSVIESVGPFSKKQEASLIQQHSIDVVVAKNSGSEALQGKIAAARLLGLPVIMLKRPRMVSAKNQYNNIEVLQRDLLYHCASRKSLRNDTEKIIT